ncbi:MAG: (2Fe-2S) ferredoxin domain-containing protein [Candidatus Marinimicrobia bacterium]|nr:(2Fe-2S) ferredoxin domain-containing protein [Candidatus Neomarinimicrobiota bacterium]
MNHRKYQKHVFVCTNKRNPESGRQDCASCGGDELRLQLVKLVNKHGLKGKIRINKSGCLDTCEMGPALVIYPSEYWYLNVQNDQIETIFEQSIIRDKVVDEWIATSQEFDEIKRNRLK